MGVPLFSRGFNERCLYPIIPHKICRHPIYPLFPLFPENVQLNEIDNHVKNRHMAGNQKNNRIPPYDLEAEQATLGSADAPTLLF